MRPSCKVNNMSKNLFYRFLSNSRVLQIRAFATVLPQVLPSMTGFCAVIRANTVDAFCPRYSSQCGNAGQRRVRASAMRSDWQHALKPAPTRTTPLPHCGVMPSAEPSVKFARRSPAGRDGPRSAAWAGECRPWTALRRWPRPQTPLSAPRSLLQSGAYVPSTWLPDLRRGPSQRSKRF